MGVIAFFAVIGFILALIFCPTLRCALGHPVSLVRNSAVDAYYYFKHKKYNNADFGFIRGYIAEDSKSFGCGKTLSAVDYLVSLYRRYDGVTVWDGERERFVIQKIHVISNVAFTTIPYEKLQSLQQFVHCVNGHYDADMNNDTYTVTYMLIDEAGSQLNSRAFRSNFDPLFIKTLLTSRHFRASVITTSQRSGMVDNLMRQCTNTYIGCNKWWRFQRLSYYDAYEIENAQQPGMVQPYRRSCWFVSDHNYNNYNTYELVGDLQKSCETGDMMTEQEILSLQCNPAANPDAVLSPSRAFKRRLRHKK